MREGLDLIHSLNSFDLLIGCHYEGLVLKSSNIHFVLLLLLGRGRGLGQKVGLVLTAIKSFCISHWLSFVGFVILVGVYGYPHLWISRRYSRRADKVEFHFVSEKWLTSLAVFGPGNTTAT